MPITETIINRINQINKRPILLGICGRAGSGKSTIAGKIKLELKKQGIESVSYSGDWRFRLDSESRKKFIEEKWLCGMEEYLRAINQFNWWDFERIYSDLEQLSQGSSITVKRAYNRETGKKNSDIEIKGIKNGIVFYENCILGGLEILGRLDIVLLLNEPDKICFERIIKKDLGRRNFSEILARQLITMYSENFFFKLLFEKFSQKLLVCNSDGFICEFPEIKEVKQIPVPIETYKETGDLKGTIFCDLDGTLIKHVPVPSETGEEIEIIEGSSEKLKEFKQKGYYLVLTTSRPYHKIFGILQKLKSQGLEFDQIISDLPVGPRHLINDSKGEEIRAVVHVLKRNQGIKKINID
jgi:uridine kinase